MALKERKVTSIHNNEGSLAKVLNKWDLLSIGIGAVIGWSWVIYAGVWSTQAGSLGGVTAFIIGGILCTFVGLVYAELASAMPRAGGDIVYTFRALGDKWAFLAGACVTVGFLVLIIIETIMFPVILASLGLPLPQVGELYTIGGEKVYLSYILVSLGVNFFFAYLNFKGIQFSKVFQTITVGVLLFAAVFYVFSGVTLGEASNAQPLFTGLSGLSLTLLMVPGFMSGFNVVAQATEEANVQPKKMGNIVIMTVWASVLFYVLIIVGTSFSADLATRESAQIVVLESLENLYAGSAYPKLFVAIAALIGMLTTWNASYIAGSRALFALGRAKYLPDSFSKLHTKNKTPYRAIMLLFIISSLGTFLGTSQVVYTKIINISGLMIVISWLLVVLSFIKLRKVSADMARPYKVPYGRFVGVLAILSLAFFIFLYTPINPLGGLTIPEFIVVAVIFLIIAIAYFKYVHNSTITYRERYHLLMDEQEERK